jgi:hypothetical protein
MTDTPHTVPALKACPFCACAMRIESNRDWHRLYGDHTEVCLFEADSEQCMVPATPDQLQLLVEDWNLRDTAPLSSDSSIRLGDTDQNEDGVWTAGIHVGAHGNKIEVHDVDRNTAEAMRDAICTALTGKASPVEPAHHAKLPDVET